MHGFVDRTKINDAIAAVEAAADATATVALSPYFWGDVRKTAERAFRRHRLDRTARRNGVFFFVVPSRRELVVIGDVDAHEMLGQHVWDSIVARVQEHFRVGDPTAGLVYGVTEIGRHLARHYPLG